MKFHVKPTEAQKAFVDRYDTEFKLAFDSKDCPCCSAILKRISDSLPRTDLNQHGAILDYLRVARANRTCTIFLTSSVEGHVSSLSRSEIVGEYVTFSVKAWRCIFGLVHSILLNDIEGDSYRAIDLSLQIIAMTFPSNEVPSCVVTQKK